MVFMVRTMTNDGKSVSVEAVASERVSCKEKILGMGLKYREFEARFGQMDNSNRQLEETVYFIEEMPELIKV